MARKPSLTAICKHCKEKSLKTEMVETEKRFYHQKCLDEIEEQKLLKELTCFYCKETVLVRDNFQHTFTNIKGRTTLRNSHRYCYDDEQDRKKCEEELKEILGLSVLTNELTIGLINLRKGYARAYQKKDLQFVKGLEYKWILETIRECKDQIKEFYYSKHVNYILSIIFNNLPKVKERVNRESQYTKVKENKIVEDLILNKPQTPKKVEQKKPKVDITKLFD